MEDPVGTLSYDRDIYYQYNVSGLVNIILSTYIILRFTSIGNLYSDLYGFRLLVSGSLRIMFFVLSSWIWNYPNLTVVGKFLLFLFSSISVY